MIDAEHLCPKCMNEWPDTSKPCSRCGFCGRDDITGENWDDFSIVEGKYLVGTAIARDDEGVTYIAMELENEKVVTLRPAAEGFAVGEYIPVQQKSEPEAVPENNEKKRHNHLPILCGIGVITVCAILALLFVFSVGATSKEDNNTVILRVLGKDATLCDDGSLWLKTGSRAFAYRAYISQDGEVSFDDWTTEFLFNREYNFADDSKFTVTEDYGDRQYKLNYEWQDDVYTAIYEIDDSYFSVSFNFDDDGGYTKKTVLTGDSESFTEQKFDSNGNLLHSTTVFEAGSTSEVTYTYDANGNLTHSVNKVFYSDAESYTEERDYRYEYSDGHISVCIATDGNGNVYVTDYEYDKLGNLISAYNYCTASHSGSENICEFYRYSYEKYVLKDGVYVATGETSGALDTPLPEKYAPTVIPSNDNDDDYYGDTSSDERDAEDSAEIQSFYTIELLAIYDYYGDSLVYRFQHDSSEQIWAELDTGNLDFVSDVTIIATGEGSDYLIVLPPDDKININPWEFETFYGICCRDEKALKEITQILYDDGYYAPDSEAYAFLQIFFDSYDEKENSALYCGTESYAQFLIYEQYMKLWAKNTGRNYELTYLPTGEVRTAG